MTAASPRTHGCGTGEWQRCVDVPGRVPNDGEDELEVHKEMMSLVEDTSERLIKIDGALL